MLTDLNILTEAQIRFMIESGDELRSRINESLAILEEQHPEWDIKAYFLKILHCEKVNIQQKHAKTKDYINKLKEFIYSNFKHYDDCRVNFLTSDQAEEFFNEIFNVFKKEKLADSYADLLYIMNQNNQKENQFTAENIYKVILDYVLEENTIDYNSENNEKIKIFQKIDNLEKIQNEKFDRLKEYFKGEYKSSIDKMKFDIKWLQENVND